jgi:glutaredoxin
MKLNTAPTALALLLVASTALAQNVYRQVDKNGKISFSDQPSTASAQPAAPRTGASSVAAPSLPYELRQVMQRYPVTLYTGDECSPCGAARSMLTTRGVPFEERTVKSNDDVAALQKLSGQASLPLLTIGSQQLRGFSDGEWSQYLDAAGYPKSSQMPPNFRNALPQPLVALKPAAPAPAAAAPAAQPLPAPAASNEPSPGNPAGIRF